MTTYATLMVHMGLGRSNSALLRVAASLAQRFNAAVIGIAAFQPIPVAYGDGFITPGYVSDAMLLQDSEAADTEIKAAETEFRAALSPTVSDLQWRSTVTFGALAEFLSREARCADLVLTGLDQAHPSFDPSGHVNTGDLVMQVGRPVLIVPENTDKCELNHALIGWTDSREARRAVSSALPLLDQAKAVTIAEIAPADAVQEAQQRVDDVVAWLKRHGIVADAVASRSTGDDAASLNLIAQQKGADLIVGGAYGHSRLREWVFGGVTRKLLLTSDRCALVTH